MIVFVILLSFLNLYVFEPMNPELQLCADLTIDAAVNADDRKNYLLKGDSYWTTNVYSGVKGVHGYWISDRWPGLPTPIDAAFAIDDVVYNVSTVFIKDNKWFLYKNKTQLKNGTTDTWYKFPKHKIMAAYENRNRNRSLPKKDQEIYFLYNKDDFSSYYFHNVSNPEHIATNKAFIYNAKLTFMENPTGDPVGYRLLSSLTDVMAAIAINGELVFFGNQTDCKAMLDAPAPECMSWASRGIKNRNFFYKCPRDPRPMTTMLMKETTEMIELLNTTTNSTVKPNLTDFFAATDDHQSCNKTDWTLIALFFSVVVIVCVIGFVIVFISMRNQNKKTENSGNETKAENKVLSKKANENESTKKSVSAPKASATPNPKTREAEESSKKSVKQSKGPTVRSEIVE